MTNFSCELIAVSSKIDRKCGGIDGRIIWQVQNINTIFRFVWIIKSVD